MHAGGMNALGDASNPLLAALSNGGAALPVAKAAAAARRASESGEGGEGGGGSGLDPELLSQLAFKVVVASADCQDRIGQVRFIYS